MEESSAWDVSVMDLAILVGLIIATIIGMNTAKKLNEHLEHHQTDETVPPR